MVNAQLDTFQTAAAGFSGVAEDLRGVDVTTSFDRARSAMPASETEQAALWLGSRLAAMIQVYATDVGSLGDLARASALNYRDTDLEQAQRFEQAAR